MRPWKFVATFVGAGVISVSLLAAAPASTGSGRPATVSVTSAPAPAANPVVIAVLDDGLNLTHPKFRRDDVASRVDPAKRVPGYPAGVPSAEFTMSDDFTSDHTDAQSAEAYAALNTGMAWVPGTNIIAAVSFPDHDPAGVFRPAGDIGSHGTSVASIAAGGGLTSLGTPMSPAPDALLVFIDIDWVDPDNLLDLTSSYPGMFAALEWVAAQDWIDIVVMSYGPPTTMVPLQDQDAYLAMAGAMMDVVESNKLFVNSAGNDFVYPPWTNPIHGAPGTLLAGANDNCGPTLASNPFPHVVADGGNLPAARNDNYDERWFSGTSAAAPRVAGFAAAALLNVRHQRAAPGDPPPVPAKDPKPAPYDAEALHDALRATAVPHSQRSTFDGREGPAEFRCLPINDQLPNGESLYAKIGYGEVTEDSYLEAAAILSRRNLRPVRTEDGQYALHESLRQSLWGR